MARAGDGPIALRLAMAFVGVALAAVALLAGLTAVFVAADVSHLVTRQRDVLSQAVAVAAGAAWDRSDSWAGADLSPVLDLAARVGADMQVRDRAGLVVTASPGFSGLSPGTELQEAVVMGGRRAGRVIVRFSGSGLGGTDEGFRADLWRAIAGAAGLAALLSLLVALAVSRRITMPVARLIRVAQAMGGGDRSARAGNVQGPEELRDLSVAFDQMADSLASQEKLRRNLVADVAHELRTPIAVLQAGHEALLDGIAEPTPGQLASLRDEVLRLARIVGDLSTLASAEAATLQLDQHRCDLADIAAAAAASLSGSFDAAGVSIERRLTRVQITGDPGRLHEVITNLLTNALKFTPPGGSVLLEAGPDELQARLSVSDTGAGIPPDELPHIFERFFRGHRAAGVAGSGIGLTIVAELVRAHHGRLDVTSTPGQGTKITVTLPGAGLALDGPGQAPQSL
jgi:two-component system, OmpR family, sensor histidine kinase BaeS